MKESRFNIYYDTEDGTRLAFNSLTCALAIVDESYTELLQNLSILTLENVPDHIADCFYAAVDGHFIVENDCDELQELSAKRNFYKYQNQALGLTIAPTLACNFKCIYCYETSKKGIMTQETQDSLIAFVNNQKEQLKHLDVSWYGGEPLLAKEVIYNLSDRLICLCEKHGIEYNSYMISNGSLLDDETIDHLIQYKVRGIQITIDGVPNVHNSRRKNKAGIGTFDLIVSNINKLLEKQKLDVSIRVNLDKTNSEQLEQLLNILSQRLTKKSVRISFGQVTAYTEACRSIETNCYNNAEFAKEILKYYKLIEKYGFSEFNPHPYPQLMLNYCCAELLNSFVVDHEGYMYKCWNEVGNIEKSVGNVTDGEFDLTNYKNAKWTERNPIAYDDCKLCSLLPVCMGGCPYSDLVLKQGHECDMVKYNIKDIMNNYFLTSK